MTTTQPHYSVRRWHREWIVVRADTPARIGIVKTRKEAVQIAKLLAGWRGKVTID